MRFVFAFAVGAVVLFMHSNHNEELWFIIKAVLIGLVILSFFRKK